MAALKTLWSVGRLALLCALIALVQCSDYGDADDVPRPPGTTKPLLYALHFHPHLDDGPWFSGRAQIIIVATAATDQIVLNIKDLLVVNVTVANASVLRPRRLTVTDVVERPHVEQLHIRLGEPIVPKKKYKVTVDYKAPIRTDDTGLYLSSYEENNVTK